MALDDEHATEIMQQLGLDNIDDRPDVVIENADDEDDNASDDEEIDHDVLGLSSTM